MLENNLSSDLKECECNLGYFASFSYQDKKYCSRCYQKNSGLILSNKQSLLFDDITEIQETLISVFNYNEKNNKSLLYLFKNCKTINDFYDLFQKIYHEVHVFVLANEAEIIIDIIEKAMITKKQKSELQHLICARVLDYWNMTVKKHKIGPCYYGNFGEKPNKINESIIFVKNNISSNINIFKNQIGINI